MPKKEKELSLNQCNFLSSHLQLEGPLVFFTQVFLLGGMFLCIVMVYCKPQQTWNSYGNWRVVEFVFLPASICSCFSKIKSQG